MPLQPATIWVASEVSLQRSVTQYNTLQHTETHCNIPATRNYLSGIRGIIVATFP